MEIACIVVVVVKHLVTLKKFCCRIGGDGSVDVSVTMWFEVEVIARALHDFYSATGLNSLGML